MTSTENKPGLAHVSDDLRDAIRELFLFHKRYQTNLRLARYILEEGVGGWGLVSEFEYEDSKT